MTFNTYQSRCAVFDKSNGDLAYYMLGMLGEGGEVAEHIKKYLRTGDWHKPLNLDEIELELGDALWYLGQLARKLGLSLDDVAVRNIQKLEARHGIRSDRTSADGSRWETD